MNEQNGYYTKLLAPGQAIINTFNGSLKYNGPTVGSLFDVERIAEYLNNTLNCLNVIRPDSSSISRGRCIGSFFLYFFVILTIAAKSQNI